MILLDSVVSSTVVLNQRAFLQPGTAELTDALEGELLLSLRRDSEEKKNRVARKFGVQLFFSRRRSHGSADILNCGDSVNISGERFLGL